MNAASKAPVRWSGRLGELPAAERRALVERGASPTHNRVEEGVRTILRDVERQGDATVLALTEKHDGVRPASLSVPRSQWDAALAALGAPLREALEVAARNIARVHRAFLPRPSTVEVVPGVIVTRRPEALRAVGVYAPGGRAAYPSSVLMGVVPARVAGVEEIIVCSPPGADGMPSAVVLAAAALAGATRVIAAGGAQAIGALAFGTATVPRVDRIVGPGNAWVAEAKRQVAGRVGIDAPAGPSELLLIADDGADPRACAREMFAQAEHDPEASCVCLVLGDPAPFAAALAEVPSGRSEIVMQALSSRGALLSISHLDEAVEFAATFAAEHLLLSVRDPQGLVSRLRHTGTVFFGAGASVAFGDYTSGANHVLPTAGAARSFSGLSTQDFFRWTTIQEISGSGAASLAADTTRLAEAEGLVNHAVAARAFVETSNAPGPLAATSLIEPNIAGLTIYGSNRAPCPIDLSDNTNLRGAPPAAKKILAASGDAELARYPSHYGASLKQALADWHGVEPGQVVTGCGSDDILAATLRAFSGPGERLAHPDPTFAMIPYFAKANGLVPVAVPLRAAVNGYDIDVPALLAVDAKVTYVCSPNNPTGTLASASALEQLLERAPGLVVLDEAYVEYAERSYVERAVAHGRLLVTRTLSKAFGLAGARVGYAIGAADLVAAVEKARGPYKVTALGERMATQAVRDDRAWMADGVAEVLVARPRFVTWLREQGLSPLPSAANFVLVPVADAAAQAAVLRQRGVAVRPFSALPGIGDALRISVGPWNVMERAMTPLAEVLRAPERPGRAP